MTESQKQGEQVILPGAPLLRPPRANPGDWMPFVDWVEVYPGNRGVNRQGIYDLYDAPIGILLRIEEALQSGPILTSETEWEGGGMILPLNAWKTDGRYHLLYGAWSPVADSRVCYAVSEDGYNWTRPNLGQIEYNESKNNNIVPNGPIGSIFQDPKAPPEERFKAIGQEGGVFDPDTGEQLSNEEGMKRMKAQEYDGPHYKGPRMEFRNWMIAKVSPDRLHWKRLEKPVGEFPSDGGNATGYDSKTDTYFTYMRVHGLEPPEPKGIGSGVPEIGIGRRSIGLSKTRDFWNWPPPKLVLYADPQDEPDISFYGGNYFTYPGRTDLHGMFVQIYHQVGDHIDNQIAFSRDGLFWYRPERRPIILVGPPGSGYEGLARASGGLIELPDGYWATLHEGTSRLHNERGTTKQRPGQIHWARWLPHRLCGIVAATEGHFSIQAIARRKNQLKLNYKCKPGGWISIELIRTIPSRVHPDAEGVPGFTFEECDRLTGDSLDQVVTWQGKSDIAGIGETVAIRLKMFQAKVFAYLV